MLSINADDWGRTRVDTDAAAACHALGAVTSVSAMVFMEDSERAAEIATALGINIGFHLNLTERFTNARGSSPLLQHQERIMHFLNWHKYSRIIYQPLLRDSFRYVYQSQIEEYARLYKNPPSRVDGHDHMHLCANMVFSMLIPWGLTVRRNLWFWPGEKSVLNRIYRHCLDRWLAQRYCLADYFFDLSECLEGSRMKRLMHLAKTSDVEIVTHPRLPNEYSYLTSEGWLRLISEPGMLFCETCRSPARHH
jgi:chitin disaccharide deacetylase